MRHPSNLSFATLRAHLHPMVQSLHVTHLLKLAPIIWGFGCRWIAAVTAPQTLMAAYQHHAHMAIVNFTVVGFAGVIL